jgi:OmpA-OmpF porin, OOP family
MKLRNALLAASILALPAAAMAQPVTGPYVSLGVGVNIFQDETIKSASVPSLGLISTSVGHVSYDVDVGSQASVGWGFGNGFRFEISGEYMRAGVDKVGGNSGHGDSDLAGAFANVLYDFDLAVIGAPGLSAYLGAGVGYAQQHFDGVHATSADGSTISLGGTRGDVALDGIVGLAYNIDSVPGLAVTAEYRFTAIPEDLAFGGFASFPDGTGGHLSFKTDGLYSHTGMVGLRYALWQPVPPPPPAPPPPPPPPPVTEARTYLVFFDWDRADLTARAKQIVSEAAQASTHVQTTRIEVNGYTDLSGTAAYNQRLSVRRAESVEAELVRDGVAKSEIEIHGYGESNPLVPTAKGVREPQNRRVEIILK